MGYAHAWCEQLSILGCRPWSRNNRNQLHGYEFALNGPHQLFKLSYWYTPTCYVLAFLSESELYPVCNRRSTSFIPTPTPAPPSLSHQFPLYFHTSLLFTFKCWYDVYCFAFMILNALLAWYKMSHLHDAWCLTYMVLIAFLACYLMLHVHDAWCYTCMLYLHNDKWFTCITLTALSA